MLWVHRKEPLFALAELKSILFLFLFLLLLLLPFLFLLCIFHFDPTVVSIQHYDVPYYKATLCSMHFMHKQTKIWFLSNNLVTEKANEKGILYSVFCTGPQCLIFVLPETLFSIGKWNQHRGIGWSLSVSCVFSVAHRTTFVGHSLYHFLHCFLFHCLVKWLIFCEETFPKWPKSLQILNGNNSLLESKLKRNSLNV